MTETPLKSTILTQITEESDSENCVITHTPSWASLSPEAMDHILSDFPSLVEHTLIIINDQDRSTPTAKIIRHLRTLQKIPSPVTFLIATGTHPPPSHSHAITLSGWQEGDTLLIHDCDQLDNHVFVGTTSRGTAVWVEKVFLEAKHVITINSVEPHYFAGFTGGIKSIIPGLAARQTVIQNHRWAITPEAKLMATAGNPLYEDLWEAGNFCRDLSRIQSIQLVNHGNDIFHMTTGPLLAAFSIAMKKAIEFFGFSLPKKVDHIISFVASPLNLTLYQAQKAMENVKSVLKDGGTFLLIASCEKGIGNDKFFQRFKQFSTPKEVTSSLSFATYTFGDHKAFYWGELADRSELLYLGQLSSELVQTSYMSKIAPDDLQKLLEEWTKKKETLLVDTNGGFTTCYLKDLEFCKSITL